MNYHFDYWFYFFLYSFFTACGVAMWDYCMTETNRLLTWYKVFLLEYSFKKRDLVGYKEVREILEPFKRVPKNQAETESAYKERLKQLYIAKLEQMAKPYMYWTKPLGYCAICFTPYVSTAVFFFSGLQSGFAFGGWWWYLLPLWFAMTTSFIFRKLKLH